MPINVLHGGQAGPVAGQIIAQSGQADLARQQQQSQLTQQLQAHRDAQMADISARADFQRQAADEAMARTALQHGLDGQIREQEFDRTLTKMQEQARLQASQWEYQYNAQQRQEIAKFNTARQAINSSDQWAPEEKAAALKMVDLQQANIKPAMMPRDPSKPVYPDGQGIGQTWADQQGSIVARTKDGDIKLIQRYDQGPEAAKLKTQAETERKQFEAQEKREQKLLGLRLKLATEDVSDGKDGRRARTADEVNTIMQTVLGGQQQPQEQAPWWKRPENKALQVTESDTQLPQQVGFAQSIVRTLNHQYGGLQDLPTEKKAAYLEAVNILKQFSAGK